VTQKLRSPATLSAALRTFVAYVPNEAPVAYELVIAGPVARAIAERLPERVAAPVIELLTGPLVETPHRVGRQLRGDLAGLRSARRGTFRVLYGIDEEAHEIVALRVDHEQTCIDAGSPLSTASMG